MTVTQSGMPQRRRVSSTARSTASGSLTSQRDVRFAGDVPRHDLGAPRPVRLDQGGTDARAAADHQGQSLGVVIHVPPFDRRLGLRVGVGRARPYPADGDKLWASFPKPEAPWRRCTTRDRDP